MDNEIFLQMLIDSKVDEALAYKNKFIPKKLYKYYPLFDSDKSNYKEENKSRLSVIMNDEIWLSKFSDLNDPFESKALIHNNLLNNKDVGSLDVILKIINSEYRVSSFTTHLYDSMPMWAHYANNHKGFCVEFEIGLPDFIYPVIYQEKKAYTEQMLKVLSKIKQNNCNDKELIRSNIYMIISSLCIKHKSWEYENEFRLLATCKHYIEETSKPIDNIFSCCEFGILARHFYAGLNCSDENLSLIKEAAKPLKMGVSKMVLDTNDNSFVLRSKKV